MNAAARLLNQGALSRSWVISLFLSRFQFVLFSCVFAILISALGLVYMTNATRSLNANLQQTLSERDRIHIQWGQLLLEKSSLLMQARIQVLAQDKLNMVIPEGKAVVVINISKADKL
jgi:cell division protein FtsL